MKALKKNNIVLERPAYMPKVTLMADEIFSWYLSKVAISFVARYGADYDKTHPGQFETYVAYCMFYTGIYAASLQQSPKRREKFYEELKKSSAFFEVIDETVKEKMQVKDIIFKGHPESYYAKLIIAATAPFEMKSNTDMHAKTAQYREIMAAIYAAGVLLEINREDKVKSLCVTKYRFKDMAKDAGVKIIYEGKTLMGYTEYKLKCRSEDTITDFYWEIEALSNVQTTAERVGLFNKLVVTCQVYDF